MEAFNGDIIDIDKNKVKTVGIGEFVSSNIEKPILATNSIHNCVVLLIELKDMAYMTHLESDNCNLIIDKIEKFVHKLETKMLNIYLFYGEKTPFDIYDKMANNLKITNVYKAYIDNNVGGIAYNFSNKEFYGIDTDTNFREYKLGFDNFRTFQLF